MQTADGTEYICHPILACFSGDYPEQCLVTGIKHGDCPQCDAQGGQSGSRDVATQEQPYRELSSLLDALHSLDDDDPISWQTYCRLAKSLRVKPLPDPFWKDLPYTHIYRSITPDALHQLYQGLTKHLVSWLVQVHGAVEIDARCRKLPPNHNIRLFMKGISVLTRIIGQEHRQISQIILGLIIGALLPTPPSSSPPVQADSVLRTWLLRAVRGLLDFVHIAQYPVHTSSSLAAMDDALKGFHDHKEVFVLLGIRDGFDNIPKLHAIRHYARSMKLYGTLDNFNTESTERLHFDLAKDAYDATNHKDEIPQMTRWLERREKVVRHQQYVQWRVSTAAEVERDATNGQFLPAMSRSMLRSPPVLLSSRTLKMSKHPSVYSVPLLYLKARYGAVHFLPALSRYLVLLNQPSMTRLRLEQEIEALRYPTVKFPVWHRIKFIKTDSFSLETSTDDSIHAQPSQHDRKGRPVPARLDTVLVRIASGATDNARGEGPARSNAHLFRVAQVRAVFTVPVSVQESILNPGVHVPRFLAYVEWFTPFPSLPHPAHGMYRVSRTLNADGTRLRPSPARFREIGCLGMDLKQCSRAL
ncbi:hypothetical protein AX16_001431 [Volvariella volvacea WC 439]|nr:hypothetical protein AX16_001431 [Volvariella volvacea WC 439]